MIQNRMNDPSASGRETDMIDANEYVRDRVSEGSLLQEAWADVNDLCALAREIVKSARDKEAIFANLGESRSCVTKAGRGYRGQYDLVAMVQAEIDYIELRPEALQIVQAEADRCLADELGKDGLARIAR